MNDLVSEQLVLESNSPDNTNYKGQVPGHSEVVGAPYGETAFVTHIDSQYISAQA